MTKIALAIHGGAGTIRRDKMTAELEKQYTDGLRAALEAGWEILLHGGPALDAVERAVTVLEDHPLFNAGRGSVFSHEGKNEMDASIMDGRNREAGAVAFVKNIKNPIKLARVVMEQTEHILLAGEGANDFAREMNFSTEPDEYFFTEMRYQQLQRAREKGQIQLDHTVESEPESKIPNPKTKIGTVGAVACDRFGDLAAATSTGGMTNKKFGRIGDTALIGAGTYADNRTCAVSCTGHGEYFIRLVSAYDVAARMRYKNLVLEKAAEETVRALSDLGGDGGLIAVDAKGNLILPFNSEGMYRAWIQKDGMPEIKIYR